MTTIKIAGRVMTASREDRTITGLLLPYGEEGRTNVGKITAAAGCLTIPEASDVKLDIEHDETRPVGRGAAIGETDDGIVATFSIARTRAGDDVLEEAAEGLRTGLSVEVEEPIIRAGALVGGKLTGAGVVVKPAFPSAQLVAADAGEFVETVTVDTTIETESPYGTSSTVEHVERTSTYTEFDPLEVEDVAVDEPEEGTQASDATPATEETEALAEAEDNEGDEPEKEEDMSETTITAAATVPTGSLVAAPKPKVEPGLRDVTAMLASAYKSGGERRMLAALSDVIPANVDEMALPGWLGELWSGVAYQRRFIPLFDQKPLTNYELKGWRWVTKPTVAAYSGNKGDVPSAAIATESVTIAAQRLAGGHDIDRKFRDFGETSFFEAYFRAMTESYARLSDIAVLDDVAAAATVVDAGTIPTGVAKGLVFIVDGALEVLDLGTPSFAVVSKDLYRDILLTQESDALKYLNAALGFESGTLEGGGFRIVGTDQLTAGSVLVGIKDAVTVHELGGVPIRVEAEDIAKGGIDEGVFGYYAVNVHDADGLALVSETGSVSA